MKYVSDMTIGNTAVKIINKNNKIKIIDVEKEAKTKRFASQCVITALTSICIFVSCFMILNLQNRQLNLDKQNYKLQSEIENIQHENKMLSKQIAHNSINYNKIYKKAIKLGMIFPADSQVKTYKLTKCTTVNINDSFSTIYDRED